MQSISWSFSILGYEQLARSIHHESFQRGPEESSSDLSSSVQQVQKEHLVIFYGRLAKNSQEKRGLNYFSSVGMMACSALYG